VAVGWRGISGNGKASAAAAVPASEAKKASPPPPPPPAPAEDTIEVEINGEKVAVERGSTVLQACEEVGVEVPRFCYHPRLSIAGNCRMCLVEVEKSPKPVASCAMPAMPGMKIKTETDLVRKAREGVMEFLLLNHPLDCPICDQGGECDLQDQAMAYGSDRGRFRDTKRSVEDKNIGPLVKTVMTRCIHCTRCVRFAKEVAGVPELGTTGRGRDTEVGTYVEKLMSSELSGNVIDLCPVGALTSKPYAFTARPWELRSTETIDVMDGVGAAVKVDARGNEILRVIPRLNEEVNEEWLSDKGRFAYDGLKRQRLGVPLVRDPATGLLKEATWEAALEAVATKLAQAGPGGSVAAAGPLACAESMVGLRDLMHRLGNETLLTGSLSAPGNGANADLRATYVAGSTFSGLEEADVVLLVGSNLRLEAPVLNARLRKAMQYGGLREVGYIGAPLPDDLTYKHTDIGRTADSFVAGILEGRHPFAQTLRDAERPAVIVGGHLLGGVGQVDMQAALLHAAERLGLVKDGWNGLNVVHSSAAATGAMDLGYVPRGLTGLKSAPKVVYLLGADDGVEAIPKDTFVVYQGHHGDAGALRADVVLPGAAYTEKAAVYVNTEGRVQETRAVVTMPEQAREDWHILRALSEYIPGARLPYDDIASVRRRLAEVAPSMADTSGMYVEPANFPTSVPPPLNKDALSKDMGALPVAFDNFYQTDSISRASQTMARCVSARKAAAA